MEMAKRAIMHSSKRLYMANGGQSKGHLGKTHMGQIKYLQACIHIIGIYATQIAH